MSACESLTKGLPRVYMSLAPPWMCQCMVQLFDYDNCQFLDILLTFDFLLKPPQPVTGLSLKYIAMMLPGPFEYISEKGSSQKIKVFLMKKQPPFQFHFRRAGLQAIWANLIGPITHLGRCYMPLNVKSTTFGHICEGSKHSYHSLIGSSISP